MRFQKTAQSVSVSTSQNLGKARTSHREFLDVAEEVGKVNEKLTHFTSTITMLNTNFESIKRDSDVDRGYC